jgi:hypothetical protein
MQHRQVVVDPNAIIACLCEGYEHPACPTAQLQHWVSSLSGEIKPKCEVLRITAVMGVVQLREHAIYMPD